MIPTITEFNPNHIKSQKNVIHDVFRSFDYSLGVHHVLLSGSVGSSKSLTLAHIITRIALQIPGFNWGVGRESMPYLKDTLLQTIIDHLGHEVSYHHNVSRGIITFENGSKIIPFSWSDRQYKKVRSYLLSGFAFEELTENKTDEIYKEATMRVGRQVGINMNLVISATNPDAPSHWSHKNIIEKAENGSPNHHVYYSLTEDNPFLPQTYIKNLKENLSPREADRMLRGKWIELLQDAVYYAYVKERNFINESYKWNEELSLCLSFDFNIGVGKPMSSCAGQWNKQGFHIAKDFVVEGLNTAQMCDEIADSGILDRKFPKVQVFGDASGRSKDTRSNKTDFEIIIKFLENYTRKDGTKLKVELQVPRANPSVRDSQNLVNAQCLNDNGKVNLFVYKDAPVADEGLRLTKLVKGSNIKEDDSDYFQHVTTAIRYWVWRQIKRINKKNKAAYSVAR